MVNDLIKKAALFHAELVSIAAEKLKGTADDFVRRGIVDDQNARRFVLDVREKLHKVEQDLESRIQRIGQAGQELLTELKITPKVTTEKIDGRIDELERQLDELRSRRELLKSRNGKKDTAKKDEIPV